MTRVDSSPSLAGRVVVVAGASGGIGSVVAAHVADLGARVVGLDLQDPPKGSPGTFSSCDLADPSAVRSAVAAIQEREHHIDALVHCAGITEDRVLWKMGDDAWQRVLDVNLTSAFYLLRAAVPLMRDRGGAVVLVTSINGERGKFGQANYAAAKAGLIGLAKTAARELGRFAIRVNCVAPGMVETPMTAKLSPEVRQAALDSAPLGRLATPMDVAHAITFLCSDMSAAITGQTLRVDAGQLIT